MRTQSYAGVMLIIALASCGLDDRESDKSLVGTWEVTDTKNGQIVFHGEETFRSDHSAEWRVSMKRKDGAMHPIFATGTWEVNGGLMICKALTTDTPDMIPVGHTTTDRVVRVTQDNFTYIELRNGQRQTYYRKR